MKWKNFFSTQSARNAAAALLAISLTASVCLPGLRRGQEQLEDPTREAQIQEIRVLQIGGLEGQGGQGKNPDASSEGAGTGQSGGETGTAGGRMPQEQAEEQEQAAGKEKEENVESQPRPESGPSLENLSDTTIGGADQGEEEGDEEDDGAEGEEGGEEVTLNLGAVLTWYKYGREGRTVVCSPGNTVGKRIMESQLENQSLRYALELVGEDAENAEITSVSYGGSSGHLQEVSPWGSVPMEVPDGESCRNYVFYVTAEGEKLDSEGNPVEQELEFTFLLSCESGTDLDLALDWQRADGSASTITCSSNNSTTRSINSTELTEHTFSYRLRLLGDNAADSEIESAEYWSDGGDYGTLDPASGAFVLQLPEGKKEDVYHIYVTAEAGIRDDDGVLVSEPVTYEILLHYEDQLDLKLEFTWYEQGVTPRLLTCEPDKSTSGSVKHNQLVGGELRYDLAFTGDSKDQVEHVEISYTSEGSGSGPKDQSGTVMLHIPEDRSSVTCTFQVKASVGERTVTFQVTLRCTNDLTLKLDYSILQDGASVPQQVTCENKKSVTVRPELYDDQLQDGSFSYTMTLAGDDAAGVAIQSVTCYQSGSGATVRLQASDTVSLLLNQGKTGENQFRVHAEDSAGNPYDFTINVPYKHRGTGEVQIETNLHSGDEVTNEKPVILHVTAWSEDPGGNRTYITATGTDTRLTVTLDGEVLSYDTTSGAAQQYTLLPRNPEEGDTNEHTLTIYAEDAYGNGKTETILLVGQRTQAGQEIGTASISIDLTVLGMGVIGPIPYTVLSEEPVSYVVAKALWGYDAGEPFGTAEQTFGWNIHQESGSLDNGFYLQRLGDGNTGNAATVLRGGSWSDYGGTEEEILAGIDAELGAGSSLAILWRCIYRNGLNKSTGRDGSSVGEHDFTNGSGWMYSVGGSAFHPGTSMSNYYLKDGDTLTLRYTLAYGHDVGNGSAGWGDGTGYCISCINGSWSVSHQWEEFEGGVRCKCCGMVQGCPHTRTEWRDLGDGTCVEHCLDCDQDLAEPAPHEWEYTRSEDGLSHIKTCKHCGHTETEAHIWEPISEDTATCTEPGKVTVRCTVCGLEQEQDTAPLGHQFEGTWNHEGTEHWQVCKRCGLEIEGTRGSHHYVYDPNWGTWICDVCGAEHGYDTCEGVEPELISATCQEKVYRCPVCGLEFRVAEQDDTLHEFVDGVCKYCGAADPNYIPPDPGPDNPDPGPDNPAPGPDNPDPGPDNPAPGPDNPDPGGGDADGGADPGGSDGGADPAPPPLEPSQPTEPQEETT